MSRDDQGFSALEQAFFDEGEALQHQKAVNFDDLCDGELGKEPSRWARWFGRSPSFA